MRTLAVKEPSHTQWRQAEVNRAVVQPSHRSLSSGVLQRKPSCACGGGCPRCQEQALLQTKLKIGEPGDEYEQEADRIADRVMQMPEPSVQRQMEPEEEDEELSSEESIAQIMPKSNGKRPHLLLAGTESLLLNSKSFGIPLPNNLRKDMNQRFGRDFTNVRLHVDRSAAQMATALNAKAFTTGVDVYFDSGQFNPHTSEGKTLLAHELVHVLQQSKHEIPEIDVGHAGDRHERQTDEAANFAVHGKLAAHLFSHNSALAIATPAVQMKPKGSKSKSKPKGSKSKSKPKGSKSKSKQKDNSCIQSVVTDPIVKFIVPVPGTNFVWSLLVSSELRGSFVESTLSEVDASSGRAKEIYTVATYIDFSCSSECTIFKDPNDDIMEFSPEGILFIGTKTTNKSPSQISIEVNASVDLSGSKSIQKEVVVEWECRPK